MKKLVRRFSAICAVAMVLAMCIGMTSFAKDITPVSNEAEQTIEVEDVVDNAVGTKAQGAAIVVGLAAAAGAIGMGIAVAKAVEGISRQPEADGKIRTTLMLGLVFIETAIIYALIVSILIIFVM